MLDPREGETEEPFHVGRWRRSIGREAPAKLVGGLGTVGCASVSRNLKPLCGPNESLTHNFRRENPTCGCGCVFFRYRTWAALLPVTAAIRAQPVARRAMYSVSEIPSKRPSVSQKVLCQEPSLSVCLCHLQHQTLIQSLLWMRAVTGQKREVCLVSGARGSPIEGDPPVWTCVTNNYVIDDRAHHRRAAGVCRPELWWLNPVGYHAHERRWRSGWYVQAWMERKHYPKIHNPLTQPSECSLASVPPASASHDCDGLALQEEGTTTCAEDCEAKSRVIASTTRTGHLDGNTSADVGWQFRVWVTTTVLLCFASTLAQKKRLHALDCPNSTVCETCIVGCTAGYELASGDSLGALVCVSENESIACLTGSLHACQVTRCSASTNPVPTGVSEDRENITYGASCQVACQRTSFPRTRCKAAQSYFPTGRWRGRRAQCGWQTVSAPDCTDLTSGDQCNVVSTAGYTGRASILTRTLDGVNGSVSLIGGLLICSATGSAVDGIPSGMNHDFFGESRYANCSDGYAPVDVTSPTLSCASNGFLVTDTPSFIPFAKPCLARAVRSSTTTPWRAWIAPL